MSKFGNSKKQNIIPLPVKLYDKNNIVQNLLNIYYSVIKSKPQLTGTFIEFGSFVWIHDQDSITELFQSGCFGKGDLSRSEPTWLNRNIQQNKESLEEITVERRRKRRGNQKVTNNENMLKPDQLLDLTLHKDVETFQLDLYEAFFLVYALNSLLIKNVNQKSLSIDECWSLFCKSNPLFHVNYVVYHFYRSLGWVPKNGSKFGVDFVLYQTGPSFKHADFAIVILPVYKDKLPEKKSWDWLLRLNRICIQVKKTLILCHVNVPIDHSNLNDYSIRQVIYKRWSPQKNRE